MSEDRTTEPEPAQTPKDDQFEAPAIVAIGKLDQVTFGAPGSPIEGASSYF